MNWSRWLSSHDAVLRLLMVLLRMAWLWPAVLLLGRWLAPSYEGVLIPLWVLLGVFLAGEILSRRVLARSPGIRVARFWAAGGGLFAILLVLWWQYGRRSLQESALWPLGAFQRVGGLAGDIPPPLLTTLIVAGVWLRGVLDGQRRPTHSDVRGAFAVGCISYTLILLVDLQFPEDLPGGIFPAWLLLFFATAMVALAAASLDLSRVTGRTERPLRLGRYWAASALTVTAFILGSGLAVAALFSPTVVANVTNAIGLLIQALLTVASYLLFAVAYLSALLLMPVVNWLRALSPSTPPSEPFEPFALQEQLQDLSARTPVHLPPLLLEALRWGAVLLVLAVLAAIFAWAVRRLRADDEAEIEETRELIWSRQMFAEQLAALLARLRAGRSGQADGLSSFLSLAQEETNRRRIRAAYQRLLAAAATHELARSPGQTPSEYAQILAHVLPGSADHLGTLTASYLAARYNPQTVSTELAAKAEEASSALLVALREQHPALSVQEAV